jgi:hypothetical protein
MKELEFGKALSLLRDFMGQYEQQMFSTGGLDREQKELYKDANELLHRNASVLSAYFEYMMKDIQDFLPNPLDMVTKKKTGGVS